jgi:hypothetical protein
MNREFDHVNLILQSGICLICMAVWCVSPAISQSSNAPELQAVSVPNNAGEALSANDRKQVQELLSDLKHWVEIDQQQQQQTLNRNVPKPPGILKDEVVLVAMGPKIIPDLLSQLDNSETASYIGQVLGKFGKPAATAIVNKIMAHTLVIGMRNDRLQNSIESGTTGMENNSASNALMFIGAPALPELARIFNQEDAKIGALWTARNIIWSGATVRPFKPFDVEPAVLNAIGKTLSDKVPTVRILAASALQKLMANSDCTKKLVQLANSDPDKDVRIEVAQALGCVGYQLTNIDEARPLIEALGVAAASGDLNVRRMAISALGHFSCAKELALKKLTPFFDDPNRSIQSYASAARDTLIKRNGGW